MYRQTALPFAEIGPGFGAILTTHDQLNADERGAVFTKPEVVDFILDLAGYNPAKNLSAKRILEPACGHGEFVEAIVDRLIKSFIRHKGSRTSADRILAQSLCAVEAHETSARATRDRVLEQISRHGIPLTQAKHLASTWIVTGDFLLIDIDTDFDFVVGNPPYVRQELIPDDLLAEYRARYDTLYNRADLYVPFFERGLRVLSANGKLCYICSDRWMKCAYGKPLRAMIARHFHLDAFVDMVDTSAFQTEVIAYPAITLISRKRPDDRETLAAYRPPINRQHLHSLARSLRDEGTSSKCRVQRLTRIAIDHHPWLLDASDRLNSIRALENQFPAIEAVGCKVGIGVATGCDRAYIGPLAQLDVEPERKLPIVMAGDIRSGRIDWSGNGLVNPFEPDGTIAALDHYPRFARYILARADLIRGRNVSKRAGVGWYRTIDRVWHHLTATPKLLIPDIKGEPNVVYDEGRFYPHHNLYWVTSTSWDLRALQCVLRSTLAMAFVASYCVKMANGFLRFQAQYIRRIRVPEWATVTVSQRRALTSAVASLDQDSIDAAVFDLYGISSRDRSTLLQFRKSTHTEKPCPSS